MKNQELLDMKLKQDRFVFQTATKINQLLSINALEHKALPMIRTIEEML